MTEPLVTGPTDGRTTDLGVVRFRLIAGGEPTRGAFSLAEFSGDEGPWTVPHVHREMEESFYVLDGTHERFEHQVEVARVRELVVAAVRADALLEVVLAEPLVAAHALDERVGERLEVAARLPHLRRHHDRGLEADDVVTELHHRAPPRRADVTLQLDAERPVIPERA